MRGDRQRHDKFDPKSKIHWGSKSTRGLFESHEVHKDQATNLELKERKDKKTGQQQINHCFDQPPAQDQN